MYLLDETFNFPLQMLYITHIIEFNTVNCVKTNIKIENRDANFNFR